MTKKLTRKTCLTDAQRLFVEEQKTITEIVNILGLSRKTVTRWKKDGNWEQKKVEFIKNKTSLNSKLYMLANVATDELIRNMELGSWEVSQVMAVKSLVQTLQPSKQYETQGNESQKEKEKVSDEELADQVCRLLGVK